MHLVLSHSAIPVIQVALCKKLKCMVGGQVTLIKSIIINNNNNKTSEIDRLPIEILSKIIYQVLISSNLS